MVNYKKVYFNHYDIGEQDRVICEFCRQAEAVDIHHIVFKSQGGSDDIKNLIALCRRHHNKAHEIKGFNNILAMKKYNEFNV